MAKVKGRAITICPAVIPEQYQRRYKIMYAKSQKRTASNNKGVLDPTILSSASVILCYPTLSYFKTTIPASGVGSELLDHNYSNFISENTASLKKSAEIIGLAFMSDGATKSRNPYSNVMAMSGEVPPTLLQ
eukprot:scaffold112064_cov23-Cyclotella_meneghiniana.AAC.3